MEDEEKSVDELVADLTADRDKYKALYEKERQAHAKTLRGKLLGGGMDGESDEDEDEDEDARAVKNLKEKLFKRSK